ncbi:MAG: alpha/beta fold hydrolase [Flavobacteriaceae bacterium]|nr:alpha/beta fold hydrolase [Flavobacteriaceae bacterium]
MQIDFKTILFILLGVIILILIFVYYFQERFIFHPEKLSKNFQFKYKNQEVEEYNIKIKDGVEINGLHFKSKDPKGVIYYLKGNSRSIKGWGKFAVDFTNNGWDVIMIDYRGFGKSTGKRTIKGMHADVQRVYDEIKKNVDEKYIVIYGRSLGTGFATKLASMNKPRLLILVCPYYSILKSMQRYIPLRSLSFVLRYPMPTFKWLKYVTCPIKIIHGTSDKTIPFTSSLKLSKIKPKLTRLYPVIDGGHKNIHNFESYHRAIKEILNSKLPESIDKNKTSLGFVRSK